MESNNINYDKKGRNVLITLVYIALLVILLIWVYKMNFKMTF